MKNRYKFLIVISILILGVIGMNYYSYNDYMNKQKERIELFYRYNYNNLESITFTKTKKNPTGSLNFYGYFNNNKENSFIGKIMPNQKEFEHQNVIDGEFARKNAKFENGKIFSVSEIEKKKREETNSTTKVYQPNWFNEKYNG